MNKVGSVKNVILTMEQRKLIALYVTKAILNVANIDWIKRNYLYVNSATLKIVKNKEKAQNQLQYRPMHFYQIVKIWIRTRGIEQSCYLYYNTCIIYVHRNGSEAFKKENYIIIHIRICIYVVIYIIIFVAFQTTTATITITLTKRPHFLCLFWYKMFD